MLFTKNNATRTPFGKNVYLRSRLDIKTESATMSSAAMPANYTVDGVAQKILQPGTLLAKITTGPQAGKVGVYSTDTIGVTDGRSAVANIVGISDTFLPWELSERDAPVAVVYEATVVQAWCIEHGAAGVPIALSNATRDAIQATTGPASLQLNFK